MPNEYRRSVRDEGEGDIGLAGGRIVVMQWDYSLSASVKIIPSYRD